MKFKFSRVPYDTRDIQHTSMHYTLSGNTRQQQEKPAKQLCQGFQTRKLKGYSDFRMVHLSPHIKPHIPSSIEIRDTQMVLEVQLQNSTDPNGCAHNSERFSQTRSDQPRY